MSYKHIGIDERIYIENQLKFKVKINEIWTCQEKWTIKVTFY
ncbi:hypothetical protein [Spiroplasma ixodetis]|uniref:Transposase n=1 Tax=Spiroplasma ixodetis TaxID=2141 RepID=A0ABM8BS33_9MOLU|nr:hypothetical protein [Spiroplasma ixodetis]BDT02657.1 hypothetical protein SHM_03030 [Spiroplasma ixodetis]